MISQLSAEFLVGSLAVISFQWGVVMYRLGNIDDRVKKLEKHNGVTTK